MMNGSCCTFPAASPLITAGLASGYHNWNLLAFLMLLDELSSPGVVEEDTSQNEARKALLNPAWTAGQKITTSKIQLIIEFVPFLVQRVAP